MRNKLLPLLLTSLLLNAEEPAYMPNFGGTLLAFFPENIEPGQYFIEPYLFVQSSNKTYKSNWHTTHKPHTLQNTLLTIFETGITPWLDISLYITENCNIVHHHKTFLYGDTHLRPRPRKHPAPHQPPPHLQKVHHHLHPRHALGHQTPRHRLLP